MPIEDNFEKEAMPCISLKFCGSMRDQSKSHLKLFLNMFVVFGHPVMSCEKGRGDSGHMTNVMPSPFTTAFLGSVVNGQAVLPATTSLNVCPFM